MKVTPPTNRMRYGTMSAIKQIVPENADHGPVNSAMTTTAAGGIAWRLDRLALRMEALRHGLRGRVSLCDDFRHEIDVRETAEP